MNQKALNTLEYNKIISLLEKHATSAPGRKLCRELLPSSDITEIRSALLETTDACSRIRMKGHLSFGSVHDMAGSVKRLEVHAALSMPELLNISSLLANVAGAIRYGRHDDAEADPDSLEGYFRALNPLDFLYREISRCILSEDTMADDASPELKSLRRRQKSLADSMHGELNAVLNRYRNCLMDPVITERNGSYCLPVKAEYKTKVPGIIQDQSSTGSTVFIEPLAVIKLNNELRELEILEKAEIVKILSELSEMAVPYKQDLMNNMKLMSHLDFVFAKAGLSGEMKASCPDMNDQGIIDIMDGRHPLIAGNVVVPINVRLGEDYDLLIVTGPNTGGKTVSLKTVGLFTLMAQSGLHVPAFQKTRLAVFDEVFADIGDEQSIEQSLSTFSGHMKNIVEIVEKADSSSLCLFDELGAGTDPTEGAALAISVLSFLHNMKIRTMATTHYSELKVYALQTPGVENASCEFDVETLRPTYRILLGIPGKSNAFAISRKLGLPQFIIDDAGKRIEKNEADFEDLITKLNNERTIIEKERAEIEEYKAEIERLRAQHRTQDEKTDLRRDRIIAQAKEEAQRILSEAKETADDTIRSINKIVQDSGIGKELEQQRERLRSGMKTLPQTEAVIPEGRFSLDDLVKMRKNQLAAQEDDGKAKRSRKPQKPQTGIGMKSIDISHEINVIGKNVDEACAELDKYLDDALLSHLDGVRIIHGRGTGALRKGIHRYLKRQNYVKSFHLAEFNDGGEAVTIVEFK